MSKRIGEELSQDQKDFRKNINFPDYFNQEVADWAASVKDQEGPYGFTDPATMDFNREMFAPGEHEKYPEGVIIIRTDDDFWAAASLPWKFKDIGIISLVYSLWPELALNYKLSFNFDSGPSARINFKNHMKRIAHNATIAKYHLSILVEELGDLENLAKQAGKDVEQFLPFKKLDKLDSFLDILIEKDESDGS
jgi:hypothetical protein